MKKMRWSLTTMICSWLELLSVLMMIWVGISYVDVLINNEFNKSQHSDWNAFQIMVDFHNKMERS